MRAGILIAAALTAGCTSLEGLSEPSEAGAATDGGGAEGGASCSADLNADPDNCGSCGNRCPVRANGFPACEAGKCKTTCNAGLGDCDGVEANGCETSLLVDGKNCGTCKRDCRGGGCNDGACQPVVLATTADNPYGMAIDATDIYWASSQSSTVWACAKTGCPGGARKVGKASGTTFFVSLDANNVYFNSNSGDALYRCAKAGCSSPDVVSSVDAPTLNRVDSGWLYWSSNTGDIRSAPVDGTNVTPTLLASGLNDPVGIAFDGGYVYATVRGSNALVRFPKPGGIPAEQIAGIFPGAGAIAADSSGVYVGTSAGDIMRFANGTTTTFAKGGGSVGYAIELTADDVFWTVLATNGAIMTAPKGTGAARALATGQVSPAALVVDDVAVYWTSTGDGTVKMLVR